MNPWALVVIGLGILIMIIGIKGSQHGLASAIVGHPTGTQTASSGGGTTRILKPGTIAL